MIERKAVIQIALLNCLEKAKKKGLQSIDIKASDIHKNLELHDLMPSVCNAMRSIMRCKDEIVNETESGNSSTFEVRYYL